MFNASCCGDGLVATRISFAILFARTKVFIMVNISATIQNVYEHSPTGTSLKRLGPSEATRSRGRCLE